MSENTATSRKSTSRKPTSRKPRASKVAQAPEPEVAQAPEPEVAQAPEPEVAQAPEPEVETPAQIERSWANDDLIEIECPACGHTWIPKRLKLSIQCPKCGTWVKVRIKADLTHYVRGLGVTASGHDTLDIGDATADSLRGLAVDEVIECTAEAMVLIGKKHASKGLRKAVKADAGDVWDFDTLVAFLQNRYGARNNGMVRMNCGNILRTMQIRQQG